jgi:hypothetical protein
MASMLNAMMRTIMARRVIALQMLYCSIEREKPWQKD